MKKYARHIASIYSVYLFKQQLATTGANKIDLMNYLSIFGGFKCSGSLSSSTLVAFKCTPSGKFRSIYSKNVDNVDPVKR